MKHLWNFLKGCLMGIANAIPGVSGGTIAVITGIYDRLIGAVSGFFRGGEGGWKKNVQFLLPIAAGLAVGLVGFSFVIVWARDTVPLQTSLFFAGLIVGSLPFVIRLANEGRFKPAYLVPFAVCAGLLVFLALANRSPETPALRSLDLGQGFWFAACAMLGMAAMVVPGISGSFVLLLLGAYTTFITGIKEFNIPVLLVFGIGAVIGLLGIAKILDLLLRYFRAWTYWAILGLVAGSIFDIVLRAVRPESLQVSADLLQGWNWPVALVAGAVGIGAALLLSGSKKADHEAARQPDQPPQA